MSVSLTVVFGVFVNSLMNNWADFNEADRKSSLHVHLQLFHF